MLRHEFFQTVELFSPLLPLNKTRRLFNDTLIRVAFEKESFWNPA